MLDSPPIPTLRTGDSYLMDVFTAAGIRGQRLAILNQIRLRLHAITVADIATPDGRSITPSALSCEHSNGLREGFQWPCPVTVTVRCQQMWQHALQETLMIPGARSDRLRPEFHLGGWFYIPVFRKWPWRYAPANGFLYRW